MFSETTYSVKEALNNESKNALIFGGIGLIKYDENRNVVWVSDLLHELGIRIVGKKLLEWQPLLAILFEDEDVRTIDINSRRYEVYNSRNNRLLFLKDVTDLTTIEKEYNDQQLCVAYLTIDNYDDSIEYADEQKSVMIETTSRQMIFDWAKDNGIILFRYYLHGFLAVFYERIYRKQVVVHFCILDEFKHKMEYIGAVMSLSMGIGRGSKVLRELDELAFSAISLSYSRGGDQVAVKTLDEVKKMKLPVIGYVRNKKAHMSILDRMEQKKNGISDSIDYIAATINVFPEQQILLCVNLNDAWEKQVSGEVQEKT